VILPHKSYKNLGLPLIFSHLPKVFSTVRKALILLSFIFIKKLGVKFE
jgi:hypothetical protein